MLRFLTRMVIVLLMMGGIGEEVVHVFRHLFIEDNENQDYSMFDIIPSLTSGEENEFLTRLPDQDEIKRVVFQLDRSSVAGLDGFSGLFFSRLLGHCLSRCHQCCQGLFL